MKPASILIQLLPPGGPAGTEVIVELSDLPGRTPVLLGFGGIGSPHEILGDVATNDDGVATFTVRVPTWVEPNRTYLFYMAYADQRPIRFSDPFLVTDAQGRVELTGTVDDGDPCPVLRVGEGTFALSGKVPAAGVGPVTVRAHLAEGAPCGARLTLQVL